MLKRLIFCICSIYITSTALHCDALVLRLLSLSLQFCRFLSTKTLGQHKDTGHKTHAGADWFSLHTYMCFCVDTNSDKHKRTLCSSRDISGASTQVDTVSKVSSYPSAWRPGKGSSSETTLTVMPVLIPPPPSITIHQMLLSHTHEVVDVSVCSYM